MENFEISETYRKYLIELVFDDNQFYTVWGTDLSDDDCDKLLVQDSKLIVFKNQLEIKKDINHYGNVYKDVENFNKWVEEESFDTVYNRYNFNKLFKFDEDDLLSQEASIEILNCLNLLQDFYLQINLSLESLFSTPILDFKDGLYNTHFWKNDDVESASKALIGKYKDMKVFNRSLHDDFTQRLLII